MAKYRCPKCSKVQKLPDTPEEKHYGKFKPHRCPTCGHYGKDFQWSP